MMNINGQDLINKIEEIKANPCKRHRDTNIIFVSPNEKGLTRFCTKCLNYTDGSDVKRTHDEGC